MRPTTAIASTLLLVSASLLHAQTPSPEPPPVDVAYPHLPVLVTPRIAIHADEEPPPAGAPLTPTQQSARFQERIFGNILSVNVSVIVNQNGRVDSAHATYGPKRFFAQAEEIALQRAYVPVRVDGNIVRVHFDDYVSIYPKERWSDHPTPFPTQPDLHTLTISLQRSRCLGSCPGYKVTLSGTGDITFDGGDNLAIPGTHQAHISPAAVLDLLERFRSANFFSANDDYVCGWTDMSSHTLTLTLNGISKRVLDYGGPIVGMPDAIQALEAAVDDATDTARWVHGNAATLPSLQAESWNFATPSAQNVALFNSAISHNDADLVRLFLAAKAPILTADTKLVSPLCTASGVGNDDLVQQMLALHPLANPSQLTLDECLSLAALNGSVPLVELWLSRGARASFPPHTENGKGDNDIANRIVIPLYAAVRSGNPDVVAILIHHHASVQPKDNNNRNLLSIALDFTNREDEERLGRLLTLLIDAGFNVNEVTMLEMTAIYSASDNPALIALLLNAGAQINLRDKLGKTPLMNATYSADRVENLLKAGADPTLKAPDGTTALDAAKQQGCTRCVDLLETALKKRSDATPAPFVP
jgi:ankyrin repeat protein